MEYYIEDLKAKIGQLKRNPSAQLIKEIEALLRDIKRRDDIPQNLRKQLASAIVSLNDTYKREMGGDVPHLVGSVVVKIIGSYNGKSSTSQTSTASTGRAANAGKIAAEGQRKMDQEIRDVLSKFNILRNFGINPWHNR